MTRAELIFVSMNDYCRASVSNGNGHAILRKDSDRFDDAVVDATGEVPDAVIAYVKEAYDEQARVPCSRDVDQRTAMKALAE